MNSPREGLDLLRSASDRMPDVSTLCEPIAIRDPDVTGVPDTSAPFREARRDQNPCLPECEAADRYQILGLLGEGAFSRVYAAQHKILGRRVALKMLRPELMDHFEAKTRFRREAKALQALNHPNIVKIWDAACHNGDYWLALELAPGWDLQEWIESCGPMPVDLACECAVQVAMGLREMQNQGMSHRDIKPRNLMFDLATYQVKIIDLGLTKFRDGAYGMPSMSFSPLGTPDYMAPEQGHDPRSADSRSDCYSLGCALYHLLAGRPPLAEHGDPFEKMRRHLIGDWPLIRSIRADVPADLDSLICWMTAPRMDARPEMRQIIAALTPFRVHARP